MQRSQGIVPESTRARTDADCQTLGIDAGERRCARRQGYRCGAVRRRANRNRRCRGCAARRRRHSRLRIALYRNRALWLPLHQRVAILERLALLMSEHQDVLAIEAAREGGKPLGDSRVEITRAIDGVRLCIEHIRGHAGDVIPMGTTAAAAGRIAFTQKEPIGVVVAVSAFNHPLNLIVHQVLAGIAAGCPVIVKPASTTPLSCLRLVQLLRAAGLPSAWCQVVVAGRAIAEALVTDRRVGFFSFIGSGEVGWSLRSKLAPGTRCALEHGGVAPVIIGPDADQELSVNAVLKGGFYHAGQVCVSVQRVYVPRGQARALGAGVGGASAKN